MSSTHFVKTHLSFSANDSTRHRLLLEIQKLCPLNRIVRHCSVSSLFYDSVTNAVDLDYPVKQPENFVYIVGFDNGLICYHVGYDLVLWNPSTTNFKKLTLLRPPQMADYRINYGFRYDEVHDDYKVVAIFHEISKPCIYAKIYSLKSDSWRILDNIQGEIVNPYSGKLVNGKLHWIALVDDGWDIMSIDLVDDKCKKVEQPCFEVKYFLLTLGVLGSDLSVLYSRETTDVWVMKKYGVKESWTKLYTIKCLYSVLSPPLCMSIKGHILHVFKSALTIYNPKDDLIRYPEVTNIDGYPKAELYIESLVSPVLQNEPMAQH